MLLPIPLALGLTALVAPMRTRNGYRGLHEFASRTRTVRLPDPGPVRLRPPARGELPAADAVFGPYRARAVLGGGLFLGDDPSLGRPLLLWVRPAADPPVPPERTMCGRVARLRWLAGGVARDQRWDAFVAPTGVPLRELVATSGHLDWPAVRPLLEDLAEELDAARSDGTRPERITLDQVWVQSDGRALLLDWPNPSPPEKPTAQEPEVRSDDELIRATARLALGGESPRPLHARQLLASAGPVRPVLAETRGRPVAVTRPRRAAQQALLGFLLIPGVVWCMLTNTGMGLTGMTSAPIVRIEADHREYARRNLDAVSAAEFAAAQLAPDPWNRVPAVVTWQADRDLADGLDRTQDRYLEARAAREAEFGEMARISLQFSESIGPTSPPSWWRPFTVDKRHLENGEVVYRRYGPDVRGDADRLIREDRLDPVGYHIPLVFGTVLILFWPPVWVAWSFATRGGFSLRWMGLALVDRRGRPAARWRCAWRTLLVWVPVVALLLLTIGLENVYWRAWEPGTPRTLLVLSRAVWWAAIGTLAGYVGLVLWRPARSLLDRLAGTWVVPR